MNTIQRFFAGVGCLLTMVAAGAAVASTGVLSYTNRSSVDGQELILRRDGPELRIVDARAGTILARAAAADTRHVVIRGADGVDDTLTVDLSNPIVLAGGIDYDGGAGGWDTLVVTGGTFNRQIVTQLSPSDGVLDYDGLVLRYSNLEPVTDTVPAALLEMSAPPGTDTITFTDGGAGTTTVSSPGFESLTFANKTTFKLIAGAGTYSVALNNPTSPTGLTTMLLTGVTTVTQSAAVAYPRLGIDATGSVTLENAANAVQNLEVRTQSGNITFVNAAALTIGGVDATLPGLDVVTSGNINVTANGTLTLADTDGLQMVHSASGNIELHAVGATSDVVASVDRDAITASNGAITVLAGQDILLGTIGTDADNDVRASGAVMLNAGRDITIDGFSDVAADDFGTATGASATATAGRNFAVSSVHGDDASFGNSGSGHGNTIINALTSSVTLTAGDGALYSSSGDVIVTTTRLIIAASSGITASNGTVTLAAATGPVDLGSVTDAAAALEISDAEVDRITSPNLTIVSSAGSGITVTQPITFGGTLTLRTTNTIDATVTGSLSAPTLVIDDIGATARTWTITPTSFTRTPGTAVAYVGVATLKTNGGTGSDTFNVTTSATTAYVIDGNGPTPPALPGDTLNVDLAGTTSPTLNNSVSAAGNAGMFTFGNRAPVTYSDIETLVGASVDLALTKSDGATTAIPGAPLAYVITVVNNGALGVVGASVVDTFPAAFGAVTWACTASAGSACATPIGSGNLNTLVDLAAGGSATITVNGTVDPAVTGTIVNVATVTAPAGIVDPNLVNNSMTDTDTLIPTAHVTIQKSAPPGLYVPGGVLTFTLAVTNAGPSNAVNVAVSDTLPAGTTFSSVTTPAGWMCTTPASGTGGTVTCSIGSLPPGTANLTLDVNVAGFLRGDLANTATATSTSVDPGGQTSSSTFTVPGPPYLIPTLGEGVLALLAALVGVIGMALRRRR